MTVLVTGGLGFIGSKVVLQLLKKDIDVLVTDLDIVKNKDKLESNILKIGKNKDKVKYQKLDINFIDKYQDKLNWKLIFQRTYTLFLFFWGLRLKA